MDVYVVSHGEKNEGGHVIGVFKSKKDATDCALAVPRCFKGGWGEIEPLYWENGCDYVVVEKVTVK